MNIKWRFSRRSFELCRVQRILRWVSTSWNTHMKWTDNRYIYEMEMSHGMRTYTIYCVFEGRLRLGGTQEVRITVVQRTVHCAFEEEKIFSEFMREMVAATVVAMGIATGTAAHECIRKAYRALSREFFALVVQRQEWSACILIIISNIRFICCIWVSVCGFCYAY